MAEAQCPFCKAARKLPRGGTCGKRPCITARMKQTKQKNREANPPRKKVFDFGFTGPMYTRLKDGRIQLKDGRILDPERSIQDQGIWRRYRRMVGE